MSSCIASGVYGIQVQVIILKMLIVDGNREGVTFPLLKRVFVILKSLRKILCNRFRTVIIQVSGYKSLSSEK